MMLRCLAALALAGAATAVHSPVFSWSSQRNSCVYARLRLSAHVLKQHLTPLCREEPQVDDFVPCCYSALACAAAVMG